jgi:hypothetical protein
MLGIARERISQERFVHIHIAVSVIVEIFADTGIPNGGLRVVIVYVTNYMF